MAQAKDHTEKFMVKVEEHLFISGVEYVRYEDHLKCIAELKAQLAAEQTQSLRLLNQSARYKAQLEARQWKIPEDKYTAGILIVEVDLSGGDVCRGLVIQDDEDYNTLLYADDYNNVWTDFIWADVTRYYVLPKAILKEKDDEITR